MFKVMIGLIAAMLANVLLGLSIAKLKEEFSKDKLIKGLFKVLFIFFGVGLMYLCSWLNPNILVANINGVDVNLIKGMEYLFIAGIVFYGSQDLMKLKEILSLKIEIKEPTGKIEEELEEIVVRK